MIDTEGSMLLLGGYVTNHANDKLELNPAVEWVDPEVRQVSVVCADTGYFSEAALKTLEADGMGPTVYCAIERQGHHRTVEDFELKPEPQPPSESASIKEKMAHRLKTEEGHRNYEWDMVKLAYNFKRIHKLTNGHRCFATATTAGNGMD